MTPKQLRARLRRFEKKLDAITKRHEECQRIIDGFQQPKTRGELWEQFVHKGALDRLSFDQLDLAAPCTNDDMAWRERVAVPNVCYDILASIRGGHEQLVPVSRYAVILEWGLRQTVRERHHEVKCWPLHFEPLWDRTKTFEIRRDKRRAFCVGDTILLREWVPLSPLSNGRYTSRSIRGVVRYVLRHDLDCAVLGLGELVNQCGRKDGDA